MKKIASILVLVFAFTITTQGQKKRKEKKQKFSIEQHTDLAVKKMTLSLDLSKKQQNEIKPILKAQAEERKAAMEKRKEFKEHKKKPSSDEMYAILSKRLDSQIAFKSKMKEILNKEQYEKFEKISKKRKHKGKEKMKEKVNKKKRKMIKEKKE